MENPKAELVTNKNFAKKTANRKNHRPPTNQRGRSGPRSATGRGAENSLSLMAGAESKQVSTAKARPKYRINSITVGNTEHSGTTKFGTK